jgi:hypothetical protein
MTDRAHARESLRLAREQGWHEALATDYAVECLVGLGHTHIEARRIVQEVMGE